MFNLLTHFQIFLLATAQLGFKTQAYLPGWIQYFTTGGNPDLLVFESLVILMIPYYLLVALPLIDCFKSWCYGASGSRRSYFFRRSHIHTVLLYSNVLGLKMLIVCSVKLLFKYSILTSELVYIIATCNWGKHAQLSGTACVKLNAQDTASIGHLSANRNSRPISHVFHPAFGGPQTRLLQNFWSFGYTMRCKFV